jgi:8-oxo-dGTP pyrophosphatase MutT (NUDIX family)
VARELEEETGYRAGHVEQLVTFRPIPGMVDAEHFAFVGRNPEQVGVLTTLSETARAEWGAFGVGTCPDRRGRHLGRGLSSGAFASADEGRE